MKRRSRKSRHGFKSLKHKPLSIFTRAKQRLRKSWSFERLEDRLVFSVAPYQFPQLQTVSYSTDTPEGALLTQMREIAWASANIDGAVGGGATLTNEALTDALSNATGVDLSQYQYVFMALPNDPLFPDQWHLLNTGQEVGNPDFAALFGLAGEDIDVVPVWNDGITGEGVVVAVVDSGVQLFHPDLINNIHPTLRYNSINGTNNASPDLFDPTGGHGTSVAGLIAASWNNLGAQLVDEDGNPVFDTDGNPVFTGGGTGVAPNATIVPIRLGFGEPSAFTQDEQIENIFQFVLNNDIDITNNSWGPSHGGSRFALPLTPTQATLFRNMVLFGRDGLGIINVFSSGNFAGPAFSEGFESFGNYDSSSYNPYVNSRYTIGVTGIDHDGQYANADGTFTSYPNAGPSVLVASPTGSNVAQNVAEDMGQGSGIWTTDLIDEFGFNAPPLGNGADLDRDLLADPNYTSRFNGTSAAAPIATGVIALMLEANPNLTYRDVQEILVRSARQNAPLETPKSGALANPVSTWQTNQLGFFNNPDPYVPGIDVFLAQFFPKADIDNEGFSIIGNDLAPDGNDGGRQFSSHFESQPGLFTNDAGFTVSQGYGVYSEQIGYAHGVVDAGLAVAMAKQWHTLGQNLDPFTEKTFTTFVLQGLGNLPAAERLPLNHSGLLIPGGIGGRVGGGFSAYWDEYYATDPFNNYTGPPPEARGESYIDFEVPADQSMNIEWVEVRVDISGGTPDDLDHLRITLVSPNGTHSELQNEYVDPAFIPYSTQLNTPPGGNPAGTIDVDGGNFVWTFSTNRNWGESTNTAVIIDPVTGEPLYTKDPITLLPVDPVFRSWELHVENWSNAQFNFTGLEVVWHGKAIAGGELDPNWGVTRAQRIQGFVGIDTNGDENFNYSRSVQSLTDSDGDPDTIRLGDLTRQLDFNDVDLDGVYEPELGDTSNLEPFAENIVVQAFRVDPVTDLPELTPTAQFLTGADGNYYFDLDPTQTYEIRIIDPSSRPQLEDVNTPSQYLQHYKAVWRITPDWYYAPDRDSPLVPGADPGEIFYSMSDANGDGIITASPVPYTDLGDPVPMAVKNINFLLKQDAPPQQFDVTGTVYADLNGNGAFDGTDAFASNVFVYFDANRNGAADAGEMRVQTDVNGNYTLTIPATQLNTYQVGVIPPTNQWLPTDPGNDAVEQVFAGPGSPTQVVNFFLDPPADAFPDGGVGFGTIAGSVFNDLDGDGIKESGENGVQNFRVFIDTDQDGVWDASEKSVLTGVNGSFFFSNVDPGFIRLDVVIPNEGTPAAAWTLIKPTLGYREFSIGAGGTVLMQDFSLDNNADSDWGDLPDSYGTTSAAGGPSHFVTPGFQLGASVDGEVQGIPTSGATGEGLVGDDDDGVIVVSNGGVLQKGDNTLRVTVAGVGGLLTGWMDFNADGQFDESERLQWALNGTNLGGEADLNPGTYDLQITIPQSAVETLTASRFRWGEQGLSFSGPAQIGEVEDYFFGLNFLFGDYNRNGAVDNADFTVWRNQVGQNVAAYTGADGNGDGVVNQADYDVWRAHFGETLPPPGAGAGALVAEGGAAALTSESSSANSSGSAGGSGLALMSGVGSPIGGQAFAFAPSSVSGSASAFQSTATAGPSSVAATSSGSNLLLIDLAFENGDGASTDDVDPSLCDSLNTGETNVNDLALAAVLRDESDWWNVI